MSPLNAEQHFEASAPAWQRQRRIMALGLLAPSLQKDIARGKVRWHLDQMPQYMPLAWGDQLACAAGNTADNDIYLARSHNA